MKSAIFYILSLVLIACISCESEVRRAKDESSPAYSKKIDSLLAIMTLDEKIGQLNQYSLGDEFTGPGQKSGSDSIRFQQLISGQVGSVLNLLGAENTRKMQKLVVENTRLGIPLLFAYDVIHGYKTSFPIPLGESCSWDLDLMKQTAAAAAHESTAAGLHWTFAPMIDVGRDARWGRVMEGAGEDPYLQSLVAKARIKGLQGESLELAHTMAATAKHFAGYGFVSGGKDYNSVNVNRSILHNQILPPFKAATEVDVATFMNAFNDIDAVPATMNSYLMQDILSEDWNYVGAIVSDWNSIGEIVDHKVAKDLESAAELAIKAGNTIDMEGMAYVTHLKKLVEDGKVSKQTIDDAVSKVLHLKFKLGLFDDPYKYSNIQYEDSILNGGIYDSLALEAARKSIVLLKNEKEQLPLKDKKNQRIAVIGPLANDKDSPLGNWRAQAPSNSAISLLEGLKQEFSNSAITYSQGCRLSIGQNNFIRPTTINTSDRSGFREAIQNAKNSDVVIMALGETAFMSGEARSRASVELAGVQQELLEAVAKVNDNIILVLMNGRPLAIEWANQNIPAIIEGWHLGKFSGTSIAEVISGKVNPSGKLTMSFPRIDGQSPVYYNRKYTGRTTPDEDGIVFYSHYNDTENSALYPFGHGLSYSSFSYSNYELNADNIQKNESVTLSVNIKNTSNRAGEEVVQVYLQDEFASETPVMRKLIDFKKIEIGAKEQVHVEFKIPFDKLGFYLSNGEYVVEKGDFTLYVGGNSRTMNSASFTY